MDNYERARRRCSPSRKVLLDDRRRAAGARSARRRPGAPHRRGLPLEEPPSVRRPPLTPVADERAAGRSAERPAGAAADRSRSRRNSPTRNPAATDAAPFDWPASCSGSSQSDSRRALPSPPPLRHSASTPAAARARRAHARHGHRQRHPDSFADGGAPRFEPPRDCRRRSRWRPTARTSSTSAPNPPAPAPTPCRPTEESRRSGPC